MGCPYGDLVGYPLEEIIVVADLQVHLAELGILGRAQLTAEPLTCELHTGTDPEDGELRLIQILAVVTHGILIGCDPDKQRLFIEYMDKFCAKYFLGEDIEI